MQGLYKIILHTYESLAYWRNHTGFEVDAVVGDVECIHVLDFLRMLWANQIEPQTVKDGEGQADWKDLPHHRHPST